MNIVRATRAAASHGQSSPAEEIRTPLMASKSLWLLLVALFTLALCIPYFRLLFWIGDEGVLLHGAESILQGKKIYTDFFEFLPPGGFVLTAAWLSVVGISFPSARTLAFLTVMGVACFTYLACWKASRNGPFSAFLVLGWAMMSQGPWTQVGHHWFTTLFAMISAWCALTSLEARQEQRRWPLMAGAAAGAAAMVTPTRGTLAVLAALTAFLNIRQSRHALVAYLLGVALVPAALIAYLAANGSFIAAFNDVVRFTAARYAPIHGVPFGHDANLPLLPLVFLFPFAALLALVVCIRDWRACVRDPIPRSCAAFCLAGFIGCYPHPDIGHIAYAAPLACPLMAYCMTSLTEGLRQKLHYVFGAAVLVLCVLSVAALVVRERIVLASEVFPTPRGDVTVVSPAGTGALIARIAATPAGETYFFYPYMPLLPFLTAREQIGKYDLFIPGYTLPSQYDETCLAVMQRADWLVIDWTWIGPTRWKQLYPRLKNAQPPETLKFERALDRAFEFVARDETFELRRRRKDVSDAVCAGEEK